MIPMWKYQIDIAKRKTVSYPYCWSVPDHRLTYFIKTLNRFGLLDYDLL